MIRLKDIIIENRLSEVPVDTFQTIGDFDKSRSFRDKRDRELLKNPVTVEKAKDFFKNTDYDFDLYFVNLSGRRRFAEYGQVSEEFIFDEYPDGLGIKKEQLNKGYIDKDNITVFYVGNSAAEKTPITAWTMAHRLGHAIRASRSGRLEPTWDELAKWLEKQFEEVLKLYGVRMPANRYDPNYYNLASITSKAKAHLFNQVGTIRSARLGKIKRPYEFYYELWAQYLKDGNVKLNRLPSSIKTGNAPYGRISTSRTQNVDEVNDILDGIERDFQYYANDVLRNCVGRIYVM